MRYRYLIFILLLIPAYLLRDYTPANELKYISIVNEAIQDGTWFTFQNHDVNYADKPPLLFWFIMISRFITGGYHLWFIGFFSLLPGIGIMVIMDKWLQNEGVRFNPLVSNLMLLTTALFLGAVLIIRMDILMAFFIVLSLYTFYKIYKGTHTQKTKYLLPIYIFLAIFSKGPMGFLIPVVSIITFLIIKKQFRTLGRYFGWRQLAIFLGLCAIWFLFIYIEGGEEYLNDILFRQTIGRGIDSFHHKEPIWFYLPRMLWNFAPWSLLFIVVMWQSIRRRMIHTDLEKFFLTVIVVSIIMLSAISSKLDIYMLPIYPFIVYLSSILLMRNLHHPTIKKALIITICLLMLSISGIVIFKDKIPGLSTYTTIIYIAITVLVISCITALILVYKKSNLKAIVAMSTGILGLFFIASFAFPHINKYIGFGEMAETAEENALHNQIDRFVYYKFYTAPNMDVYIQRELECINSVQMLDSMNNLGHKSILFVRKSEEKREQELREWLSTTECKWTNGRYSWYILGKDHLIETKVYSYE